MTDGEKDLIIATKVSFKNAVHGRCTNHFKQNCKDFIEKNVGKMRDVSLSMDVVFGDDGLVESSDKKDLKKKVTDVCQVLDARCVSKHCYYISGQAG